MKSKCASLCIKVFHYFFWVILAKNHILIINLPVGFDVPKFIKLATNDLPETDVSPFIRHCQDVVIGGDDWNGMSRPSEPPQFCAMCNVFEIVFVVVRKVTVVLSTAHNNHFPTVASLNKTKHLDIRALKISQLSVEFFISSDKFIIVNYSFNYNVVWVIYSRFLKFFLENSECKGTFEVHVKICKHTVRVVLYWVYQDLNDHITDCYAPR